MLSTEAKEPKQIGGMGARTVRLHVTTTRHSSKNTYLVATNADGVDLLIQTVPPISQS